MAVLGTYTKDGNFIRVDRGAGSISYVPVSSGNADYQYILDRMALGDTVDPYVEPVVDIDAVNLITLNDMLTAPGTATRALALVTFDEINVLRVNAGLQARTLTQFKAALQVRMK